MPGEPKRERRGRRQLIIRIRLVQAILERGEADPVLLARELLRDPYFPRRAAAELGVRIEGPGPP